jgi:hypothetical protein
MSSLLPDVLDALVDAAQAAAATPADPLYGVIVVDGPVVQGDQAAVWLFIGAADNDDDPGATTADGSNGQLPEFVTAEQVVVACTIVCEDGDGSEASRARRRRAYAVRDRIEQLLTPAGDGDVVLGVPELAWARIASTSYTPTETTATVGVSVACQAHVDVV